VALGATKSYECKENTQWDSYRPHPLAQLHIHQHTGPQADLNLGIQTFLNGQLVSNIVIDTSAEATDTIDYVATDQSGLTATSTRTVIISSPTQANTTASTTTSQ
jgi:hypothetical protein